MIYIIGSGPAGVSAAMALLARDVSVTMLDVGITLEADKKLNPLKQSIDQIDQIKLSYGSDYIYRGVDQHIRFECSDNIYCKPSFAQGGLSNVWGAFAVPYTSTELQYWPFPTGFLSAYYQKIFTFLPLAMGVDDNVEHYPLYSNNTMIYQHSQQAKNILAVLKKNKAELKSSGFEFGSARLSVHFFDEKKQHCIYCGHCQRGCPEELIYSARDTLAELKKNPRFHYQSNVVVSHFVENDNDVTIYANDFLTKAPITITASQIFCAAGAIGSTKILLASLKLYNTPVTLKDSQHFMIPAILYQSADDVASEKLHALTQLYLKLQNQSFLTHPANLQLYTYMDYYALEFQRRFKFIYPWIRWALKPILNRMIVLQGFLDAADSSGCEMQLSEDNQTVQLNECGEKISKAKAKINQLQQVLFQHRKQLGFIPLRLLSKISKILRSYHYGGSFPMSTTVCQTTTDLWGRPFQCQRVHVIDATVFPTIPAGAITPSIMANAYRIASECNVFY